MNELVYLDNCCFNRPYDNQLHPLVKLETQAKFDYTEWQRDLFSDMTLDGLCKEADDYWKETHD